MTSKSWVIIAVLASIADAEQYFSADNRIARSTFSAASVRPLTTKCMWMCVKILGSCCARSPRSRPPHPRRPRGPSPEYGRHRRLCTLPCRSAPAPWDSVLACVPPARKAFPARSCATPGLADERAVFNPFDARFHCCTSSPNSAEPASCRLRTQRSLAARLRDLASIAHDVSERQTVRCHPVPRTARETGACWLYIDDAR
jgi:hypothetical protein